MDIKPQINPCATAPGRAFKKEEKNITNLNIGNSPDESHPDYVPLYFLQSYSPSAAVSIST